MISKVLFALESAWKYIRIHPQIQFALILVLVLPIAFLYTSNAFLEAGKANQDKLQRDRIGLLHDSFVSLLSGTDFSVEIAQTQMQEVASLNPDITKFRLVQVTEEGDFKIIAALDPELVGQLEESVGVYQTASVRFDESLIFPYISNGVRYWQSVRAIRAPQATYFILSENSFAQVDSYLEQQEQGAYYTLILVYLFMLLIAYWHIKTTNYQHLYQEAQTAIKTKDLFTNMIAHELRAPLTAIRGYASMLSESELSAEQAKYSTRIGSSSERLLAIVNDLLDVARIQSGKLQVETATVEISAVAQAVADELASMASDKNLTVSSDINQDLKVQADPKRLHQVLTNIVSNSIKYTKSGSVVLGANEKGSVVELRIKDTGMGISAEDQQKLFAPFYRVENQDVSSITGTGLGMWITRQFVELMNGSIAVESIKDVGTHVVITLPKAQDTN